MKDFWTAVYVPLNPVVASAPPANAVPPAARASALRAAAAPLLSTMPRRPSRLVVLIGDISAVWHHLVSAYGVLQTQRSVALVGGRGLKCWGRRGEQGGPVAGERGIDAFTV